MDSQPNVNQTNPNREYTDQEKREIAVATLSQDFPSCAREIKKAIDCQYDERPVRNPDDKSVSALYSGSLKEDPCKLRNGEMTWCILKHFCPEQGNALQECMDGDFPGKKNNKIPPQCILSWRRFDKCMIKKTDEFATSMHKVNTTKF